MKKNFLMSTATALVASSLSSGVALAQQSTQADAAGIGEIVVTAQRREETVQKSSLAIEVVKAEDLVRRGVSEARDLSSITPAISVAQAGVFTQTNIRGAGDAPLNGLRQNAVSYFLDGVVFGQPLGVSSNFYDLARVEILKGPQGTLYGRNATGGAVNLISQRPTQKFEGYLTGEVGNYNSKKLTGALNIPLSDTLAVRGAFNITDRDGYLSDGTDDDVRQSGRLQAFWEPTDTFNLRVFGDYSHTGGNGGGVTLAPKQPGIDPWTSISHPVNNAFVSAATGGLSANFFTDSVMDMDQWDVGAELNADLGEFATLTFIPAYRNIKFHQISNSFSFPSDIDPQETSQTSYELRLGNQTDKLKWTVGAYYFQDDTNFHILTYPLNAFFATLIPNFNTRGDVSQILNESVAGFGEATYSVTEQLRIIGGLRYTHDKVAIDGAYGDQLLTAIPQVGEKTFNALTWKAGVEFDLAPQSMAFATVSKGFKSGGFYFVPDTSGDNKYTPEKLTSFDIGIRNRFFDNTLQVNLEAFYWKYEDQQLSTLGFTSGGSIAYLTRNAGKAEPKGANLDVVWQATPNDTLGFAVNYTDANYDEFTINFPAALAFSLRTGPLCTVPTAPTAGPGGLPVLAVNCAGAPLPRTPEWSGNVNYEHVFQLGDAGDIAANVSASFATSRYVNADFFIPEEKDEGYVLLNADVTYTPVNDRFSITAFGRNLTEEAVYQGGLTSPLNGFVPGTPNLVARQIGEPRVYGVRATVKF